MKAMLYYPGFRSRSRGIWLEPELSLWPGSGSGSSLNFSLIIHANCMVLYITSFDIFSRVKYKLASSNYILYIQVLLVILDIF